MNLEQVVADFETMLAKGMIGSPGAAQSIRILLDALEEAQRDAKRYRHITAGPLFGPEYHKAIDAAIYKAMEQPK